MADLKSLKELALYAAKKQVPADMSKFGLNVEVKDVDEALKIELNNLASDFNQFRRNKLDIFEIIQVVADEIVPNKVIQAMGVFAEVKVVANGVKTQFRRSLGKQRAKNFITRAAVAGVYETFRLDADTYEVSTFAVGGGFEIDFERFLAGDENISDYMDILVEGLADAIYTEVQNALQASVSVVRPANTTYSNVYSASQLQSMVNVVRAYGTGAVIFASEEFITNMGADAIVPAGSGFGGVYSPDDIESIHNTGMIRIFRGCPIVPMPQSFTDIDNVTKVISPKYAYIFPSGGEKVVKVVLEGNTIVDDVKGADWSMIFQAYKKFGVAIHTYYNWAVYYIAGLT